MVSPLWKACADGSIDRVADILAEDSVDIEIKDHTGVTPLISAIQGGHVEIVRVLLDKGADPRNGSSQGPPEQHTSDPAIIDLLNSAKNKTYPVPQVYPGYSNDPQAEAAKAYYPPPGAYYYPGMPPPMMHQGPVPFYPPPVMDPSGNGLGNLPPPDVARLIPCRYYPACRYGASCMFAHPDPTPSLNGPMPPPAQYPSPYDQVGPAPFPSYYPPPPPPSYPPYGVPPMNPTSPNHHAHARQGSEVISPIQQFSPNGVPPPGPYGVVSPVSPVYAHPGPVPVPLSMPPPHPGHLPTGPQSPQHMYQQTSPTAPGGMPPQPYGVPYHPQSGPIPNGNIDGVISPKPAPAHPMDGYNPIHRDPMTHHRRGSARRLSVGGRGKPPCLFFPSGRCRNGDDCRFPHVLPEAPFPHHQGPPFGGRGGHRPRPSQHHVNGLGGIEDKLATMNIQEDGQQGVNGNATENSSRSQSTDPGNRPRTFSGFKPNHYANGHRPERRVVAPRPQRVPSADEFPVLGGNSTPPLRSPGANGSLVNGHNGPTAAQILQAPPPVRKETQPGTPNSDSSQQLAKEERVEPNGASVTQQDHAANKLPVSFAAVAAAVTDVPKEVSVTA
ncbi:hypothetical protein QCA50_002164 [Cerrena zonata]|uniref:C3H1-type domain-containing protein n=1 Tax=Cerrena zonata TaxID=2478898 RepID=A0AAW0GQQ1_9APHY